MEKSAGTPPGPAGSAAAERQALIDRLRATARAHRQLAAELTNPRDIERLVREAERMAAEADRLEAAGEG